MKIPYPDVQQPKTIKDSEHGGIGHFAKELAMLQHRFVSGGLGEAPDLNLVMDAKSPRSDFSQAA